MTNHELDIRIRLTEIADPDTLFKFQLDKEGGYLAAFMQEDPTDKSAYRIKHTQLLEDPTVNTQTILLGDVIVESIAEFVMEGYEWRPYTVHRTRRNGD